MKSVEQITSVAAPLLRANIDTDAIIASKDISSIGRSGLGKRLFAVWRYLGDVECPDFILNKSGYRNASVLLCGENFGCGSSREAAVWALVDYGVRCVIAPSFGKIFYQNSFRNGLLPIRLPMEKITTISESTNSGDSPRSLTVDLNASEIRYGKRAVAFDVEQNLKEMLLLGLDDIGVILRHEEAIAHFEAVDAERRPWIHDVYR